MWWPSTHECDNGEAWWDTFSLLDTPGLAGLSLLEMRQLDEREKPLVVGIFGCGLHAQQKLTNSLIMSR